MPVEIERKFLVHLANWEKINKPEPVLINQGYLLVSEQTTIRVRFTETKGFLTIKGKQQSISRDEYEYVIPLDEAQEIFHHHCGKQLTKKRYKIQIGALMWEVDEYLGNLKGLVVAEVELTSENQPIEVFPEWIGEEVTQDISYSNAHLASIV